MISAPVLLEQTAEECCEMAHACLKVARILRDENPTPISKEQAVANVEEEMADTILCADELLGTGIFNAGAVGEIIRKKTERWKKRLEGFENEGTGNE